MKRWLEDCEAALGRDLTRLCLLAVAVGIAAFARGAAGVHAPRVFAAVIAGWLFLAGAVMGAIAFGAALELSGARWAGRLIALASAVTSFVPVALVVLVLLVVGLPSWAPWYDSAPTQQTFWLNVPFFSARELLASLALFGLAYLGMRPGGRQQSARRRPYLLVTFLLAFAVVLSVWAFDFVVALDPVWGSTGIGFHLFVGAAASGASLLVLLGLGLGQGQGQDEVRVRHDTGTLLLTLSLLWGYLFWAQFLTTWYANLPSEIGFVLRRMTSPWSLEAVAVVLLCFVVPFSLMLRPRNKSNPRWLGIAAAAQLCGLWLERHLLVVPSLSPTAASPFEVSDLLISLGLAGAFLLAIAGPWKRLAPPRR
jgi:hypothetical protein